MRDVYWHARSLARAAWPLVILIAMVTGLLFISHSVLSLAGVTGRTEMLALAMTGGVILYVSFGRGMLANILKIVVLVMLARSSRLEL